MEFWLLQRIANESHKTHGVLYSSNLDAKCADKPSSRFLFYGKIILNEAPSLPDAKCALH